MPIRKFIPDWTMGGPRDFWMKDISFIKDFIDKYKLQPHTEFIPRLSKITGTTGMKSAEKAFIWDPSIYGGMKIAHLHYKDDIFILNKEQWKDFSGQVLDKFRQKLNKINSVNYEQLMELSNAVSNFV